MTLKEQARNLLVFEFTLFAGYHDEEYFDPRNRDMWVAKFCEWMAEKQRKSAEIRASND